MTARLIPICDTAGPPIALQRPVLLFGRHPECDVRLEWPQVSRRHCCLALADDRLTVRDLGSRNGVWVNGAPVDEARLAPGDEIAIAHLIYRLEQVGPPVDARGPEPVGEAAAPMGTSDGTTPSLPELPDARAASDDDDLVPLDDDLFPLD